MDRVLLARTCSTGCWCWTVHLCIRRRFLDASGGVFTGTSFEVLTSPIPAHYIYPGPLGQGLQVDMSVLPARVARLDGVSIVAVAVGRGHAILCSSLGAVYSFGYGSPDNRRHSALGHGNLLNYHSPHHIAYLSGVCVISVAAGKFHSLLLTQQGRVITFGANFNGQLGRPRDAVDKAPYPSLSPAYVEALQGVTISGIAAGGNSSFVWSTAGVVYYFGANDPCMGHGEVEAPVLAPQVIAALVDIPISAVSLSTRHTLAISFYSELYSWGKGNEGQLGHGSDDHDYYLPRLVDFFAQRPVMSVAAGCCHSVVLCECGVYTFGDPRQLGHATIQNEFPGIPRAVSMLHGLRVCSVHAGTHCSYAVTLSGDVYFWGSNLYESVLEPEHIMLLRLSI